MNPFIVSGFAGSEFFCNRKQELKKLKEAFQNRRNVTLFSLRRMGKSSLIKFLFEKIKREADCIYVDIYSATNLEEMIQHLANAITNYYGSSVKGYLSKISNLIKSLNATLSYDDITGRPEIKIGIGDIKKQKSDLNLIIEYLEKNNKRVLLVFDEFQAITNFPEKNVEAILRTIFQECKNINFIFSGSNLRMMQSIFSDKAKPFYQSTQYMHLEEIEKNEYKNFIKNNFKKGKQSIDDSQIDLILEFCRRHTYYVQMFCNRLYSKEFKGNKEILIKTLEEILKENEPVYFNYKNLLTDSQWKLVNAVANEGSVKEPLSGVFIKKYNLKSSSSVQRTLDSLLKKETLLFYKNVYIVYDVFFSLWLKFNAILN